MESNGISEYCEFMSISKEVINLEQNNAYINFLRFCVERLRRGDQVQAIWRDYLDQVR